MAQWPHGESLPDLERADGDLPLGVNLAWRIQVLIESGRLKSLERLPGVRELATGAGVNTNTARSVYRRLENDGLAVSRQGLGTFVAPYVIVTPALEQFAAQVAADALSQGIDPRQLARALYSGSSSGDPFEQLNAERDPDSPASEATLPARASLRAQIARLEASLAPYPEAEASAAAATRFAPHPHIAELGELEAIRDDLVARLASARAEAELRAERESVGRGEREVAISDPSPQRWGPVGALMNWWRVKISSGSP
ncbi:MAG: GntR family transcriptional regulator [Actinomycetota bacterium]|nr:GntR family transcriptional regulator [Actinomycetota bacterium]